MTRTGALDEMDEVAKMHACTHAHTQFLCLSYLHRAQQKLPGFPLKESFQHVCMATVGLLAVNIDALAGPAFVFGLPLTGI